MLAEIFIDQTSISADLEEINRLQRRFDFATGTSNKKGKILSYNPVLNIWNFQRFGQYDLENFKKHEEIQIETLLEERYGVTKRPAEFTTQEDGEVYSKDFPNQPFDVVLQRGIEYRRQEGSKEQEREQSELIGWVKIREKLLDKKTPLGSKFIVISGPGIVKGTMYPDNYVDVYESATDFKEKKRIIRRKRFMSGISYEDYTDEIKSQKPDYFDNFKGPVDAWFLENPIFVDTKNPDEVLESIFKENKSKTSPKDFEEIFTACMPIIQFYINILCDPEFEPKDLAIAFNAIINKADHQKEALKQKKKENIVYESVQQQINYLGHQPVQNILAGCGLSGGFNVRSKNNILANSVAQFGVEKDQFGELEFECTNGHKNRRQRGELIKKCCVEGCTGSVGGDGCKKAA